jgi:propionyl-CoA carboxylase alpha chain
MADEAVHIGPPAGIQSYIVIDKIIEAIRDSGAEAVHPGYGFLSENAGVRRGAGGRGRRLHRPAGGRHRVDGRQDHVEEDRGRRRGLHRARLHGPDRRRRRGGEDLRGDRLSGDDQGVRGRRRQGHAHRLDRRGGARGFQSSKNEAASAFGDDRIFIEKFVTQPRHIEIQVLCDSHGNGVYLGERECSIQRRNQKVIEEAPSPFLDGETRKAMGEQAWRWHRPSATQARARWSSSSTGRKEFLLPRDEHPPAGGTSGDGADHRRRSRRADDPRGRRRVSAPDHAGGHQAERAGRWRSRLYAEDPYRNFLPSIGRLTRYRPPAEGTRFDGVIVRNDTGVYEGGEISMFYDPMIAKLCTHAPTRLEAVDAMADALDRFEVEGIGHNLPFLSALMQHPRWREGRLSTGFIAEEYPDGFAPVPPNDDTIKRFAIAALLLSHISGERNAQISGARFSQAEKRAHEDKVVRIAGQEITGHIDDTDDVYLVRLPGREPLSVTTDWTPGAKLAVFDIDGVTNAIKVEPAGHTAGGHHGQAALYGGRPAEGLQPPTLPGFEPFTRGVKATMYAGRPWTIRQYAGSRRPRSPTPSTARPLAAGQQGCPWPSTSPRTAAMTATTPRGRRCRQGGRGHRQRRGHEDPVRRHPARQEISVSMTMNGAVIPVLASFIVAGEEQGVTRRCCQAPSRTTSSRSSWSATPISTRPNPRCGSSPTSSATRRKHAEIQLHLDLRLPHAGGRREPRAGARLHHRRRA